MQASADLLREFVTDLMESSGALVDPIEPAGLEFVAPPELCQVLQLSEVGRLGFGREIPANAERVSLESDWLERLGRVLGQRGRFRRRILSHLVSPPADLEKLLERSLSLQNAIFRFRRIVPAWTRYGILTFRFAAISDERREGLLSLGLNLSNGSALDDLLPLLLEALAARQDESDANEPEGLPEHPPSWLRVALEKGLQLRLIRSLAPFLSSMQRRLERDMARIYGYYNDLHQESLNRLERRHSEPAREHPRLEAIAREHETKIADLQQNYALKVEVEWVQTLELVLSVHRFEFVLKRRKGERPFHLDWNPLVRRLEPAPCEATFTWEVGRLMCDEALHLVSLRALADCATCEKPYCQACHPRGCPKCGAQPSHGLLLV